MGRAATSDYAGRLAPFDTPTLARWAADCAEHVLRRFEALHPLDDRPRRAIEAARAWARGELKVGVARAAAVKAHAAAREAGHPAAVAAARAAGHAAGIAHMVGHARDAAAYALVSAAAAASEDGQGSAVSAEKEWQLARLPKPSSPRFSKTP